MDYMPYDDEEDAEVAHYRTAMVCEKGHLITDDVEGQPATRAAFCQECGAKTLAACPKCGEAIRGYYKVPGVADFTGRVAPVPTYCHACGHPYPWTASKKRAWRELVEESDVLSKEEKERLTGSIDDLIADTPGTNVAVMRVKKWLAKAGNVIGPLVKQIVLDVGTEAVKKSMGL